ncbi:MAG: Acidobacterial duplicated orphan permease (function unknown) [uncultured Chthoniobacterales bacterium]|uniref:ABC-type antimicrobial peptide transport system, permease component n=1 Tax=uncultured Chthoniobacterales bacterium TaxID=1836801 RepID=A0A6J4HEZ1_9BACT|nr:MAG: Acidobacterial duplicated orphan permease (function unknown) [uncultured Chthoniobacterales bacterium]
MNSDLRYAFRQLLKAPGFSATAVIALALGIGATTAMFGVIYAFLLRPLPFAEPEKLVMLQSRSTKTGADLGVNYLDFKDWREQSRSFADVAFFNLRWNGNLRSNDGATETLKTTFTTANLFMLLGREPVLGRNLLPADDAVGAPRVMLISHRVWQRSFGGAQTVIGRDINLDGEMRTIVGVMPKDFRFPVQSDVWVPMGAFFEQIGGRSWRADQAIGRLKPGVVREQAAAEMKLIAERLASQHPETNKEVGAAVVPLRQHWTGDVRGSLVVLLAGCGGVLLIACANVGQLLLARATSRQRELLVRAALGASRMRLARQLLTESALIAVLGSCAGVVMAFWLIDIVAASIPVELPFWIQIEANASVLAFTVIIASLSAIAAGSLPAWKTTRVDVSEALKRSGAGTTGGTEVGGRVRDILTAGQVAISIVLLVGASLVLRSMGNLKEVDPGFDARNVLLMEVNPTYRGSESAELRVDRYTRLLDRIARIPGVVATAANNSPPFHAQRPWNRPQPVAEGQSVEQQAANPRVNFQTVSPEYFRLLQIPLQHGRAFDARDKFGAPRVCIVSERLAQRLWPGEDAVGKRLMFGKPDPGEEPDWLVVVGVAADVRHQSLDREAGPDLYNPSTQLAWKQMHFLVRAQPGLEPMSLVSTVQREVAAIEPEVGVFNFVSLGDEVANSLWQPRLRAWLLSFFSLVALLLAATGLYGVIAYRVTQRTREIGIRMALGATRGAIVRLMLSHTMRAVVVGMLAGFAGALLLSRLLQATLFGISSLDLASYGTAAGLLMLSALGACWIPARRVSNADPVKALRTD